MRYFYVVAAVMLLVCLLPMPYGYYNLVRIVTMAAFAIKAVDYRKTGKTELCIGCIAAVVLFQPLVPISLGRLIWAIIDVIAALFFFFCAGIIKAEKVRKLMSRKNKT